jgi:hypothetical protein
VGLLKRQARRWKATTQPAGFRFPAQKDKVENLATVAKKGIGLDDDRQFAAHKSELKKSASFVQPALEQVSQQQNPSSIQFKNSPIENLTDPVRSAAEKKND